MLFWADQSSLRHVSRWRVTHQRFSPQSCFHQLRSASAVYRAKPTASSRFSLNRQPGQSSCSFVWMPIGPAVLCLAEIDSDRGAFQDGCAGIQPRNQQPSRLPTSLLELWEHLFCRRLQKVSQISHFHIQSKHKKVNKMYER